MSAQWVAPRTDRAEGDFATALLAGVARIAATSWPAVAAMRTHLQRKRTVLTTAHRTAAAAVAFAAAMRAGVASRATLLRSVPRRAGHQMDNAMPALVFALPASSDLSVLMPCVPTIALGMDLVTAAHVSVLKVGLVASATVNWTRLRCVILRAATAASAWADSATVDPASPESTAPCRFR